MRPFTFKREATWLFLVGILPPAVGIFLAIVLPMIVRWLAGR